MSEMTHRRDPAPSRLRYRLHRLWLTPLFRWCIRVGLPITVVVTAVAMVWTTDETRFAIQGWVADLRQSIETRPEFMVHVMAIDGASTAVAEDIREIVPVDFPVSSFDLDLEGMQARIAELDAVARVDLRVRSGGVLQMDITERVPVAVWRVGSDLELLDAEGHRVAALDSRLDRADLPLLAGAGAERAVPEAMELLAAAEPVNDRLRGLVRIGERRWDLVLDRDQRIMLPEKMPLPALEQVMALDQANDLLSRDVLVVDFRKADRPTLRLSEGADQALHEMQTLQMKDDQ